MKSVLLSLGPFLASKSSEWMAQESVLIKNSRFLGKIMRNFTFKMLLGVLPKTTTRGCCQSFLNERGGLNRNRQIGRNNDWSKKCCEDS